MRGNILKTALVSSLLVCVCAGIELITGSQGEAETVSAPSPAGTILMYSDWIDREGHKLRFTENFTGELDGVGVRWEEAEEGLKLKYRPETELSESYKFRLSKEQGKLCLELGDVCYTQLSYAAQETEEENQQAEILELGQHLADYAASFEGCKYVWGGNGPESGFDCSGLVCYVYKHFGYSLQRVAAEQAKQGIPVETDELCPGDVLCFYNSPNYIGLVGIYLGDGNYIHAMGAAYGVVKTPLDAPYTDEYETRQILGCSELLTANQENAP